MSKTMLAPTQRAVTKVDLKKRLKHLYYPLITDTRIVNVPDMQFLMIDGTGNPNISPAYQQAIEALYGVAYTMKFLIKKELAFDFPVMPLEGLWWVPEMREFSLNHKDDWYWTMMIMQPAEVTPAIFRRALAQVQQKKDFPALAKMRLEHFNEGLSAQIMHIGPFATEGATIARLHAFIREQGYLFDGLVQKHHEIYLSDPRRAAPEKIKTLIRQPIISAS